MGSYILQLLIDLGVYVAGYVFTSILGGRLVKLLDKISSDIDNNPPTHIEPNQWKEILSPGNKRAGLWLGRFERLFFLIMFISEAYILAGFWLAFKVASKWETWQNIVQVPDDEVQGFNLGVLDRRNWGDRVLQRFLLGTLGNLLAGFFGYMLVEILQIIF
jgi:hypothetical protein